MPRIYDGYGCWPGGPAPKPAGGRPPLVGLGPDVEREAFDIVAEDGILSRGMLFRPKGKRPKVAVHMLHPRADFTTHQYLVPFIQAGYMALGCDSRWPNNDEDCIHETLLLDFAAGMHLLQEQGAEKIVLLGSSG